MGLSLLKWPQTIVIQLIIILLTLCTYVAFPPLFIVVLVPIYSFRYFVAKIISPILRPELGKMLTALSSSFVVDIESVYAKPKNVILVNAVLEGSVNIDKFRKNFTSVMDLKDPKGNLLYPELKQRIVSWLGFFFWKKVQGFKVENHVKYIELEEDAAEISADSSREAVQAFSHKVLGRPFKSDQSPWEFLIIPLSPQDAGEWGKTLVLLRSHHALADGYSLFNLVLKHAEIKEADQAKPKFQRPKPSSVLAAVQQALQGIIFPFRVPYDIISQFFSCYDSNSWHIPEKSMARDTCGMICEHFPVQAVKNAKAGHNTSFAAVLLAGLAGGIRKTMMQQSTKIPSSIHCLTPMPLPGHPEKLRNYMTGCFVKLPLDIVDPVERLKAIEHSICSIKKSTLLHANYLTHRMVGGLFSFVMKKLWKPVICTSAMSCFPGLDKEKEYLGHRMLHTGFVGHIGVGNLGVLVTVFSYNGTLEMCLSADKNVIKTVKGERALMDNILAELNTLCHEQLV